QRPVRSIVQTVLLVSLPISTGPGRPTGSCTRGCTTLDDRRGRIAPGAGSARGGSHPDLLGVGELADPVRAELAAVAGALDASGGQARIGLHDPVDQDMPRLDAAGHLDPGLGPRPARSDSHDVRIYD